MLKLNKMFFVSLLLLTILTLGAVSASDMNITQQDSNLKLESNEYDVVGESQVCGVDEVSDEVVGFQDDEIIEESADDIIVSKQEFVDEVSDEVVGFQDDEIIEESADDIIVSKQEFVDESQVDNEKLQSDSSSKGDVLGSSKSGITISAPEKFVLGQDILAVDLPDDAKGSLTIYVDGKVFEKIPHKDYFTDWDCTHVGDTELWHILGCSASTNLLGLSAGKHTIKAVFTDSKYGTLSAKKVINLRYFLSVDAKGPYTYGYGINEEGSKIIINLPKDVKKNPIIKIDGKTLKNFKKVYVSPYVWRVEFHLDTSKVSAGTHTLKVSYKEGKKYPYKSLTKKFKVAYSIFSKFHPDSTNSYIQQLNMVMETNMH